MAASGERVIQFAKRVGTTEGTRCPIGQLVRAATSAGANYVEADDADSKKDFRFKMGLCRREAQETKPLWREAQEVDLIFGKMRRSC